MERRTQRLILNRLKYRAEKEVLRFTNDMDVVIVRPTRVYGPRDMRMLKIFNHIQKKRFFLVGKGEVFLHPIYLGDLLKGFEHAALQNNISGEVFYLGGEPPLMLKDFLESIAGYLGVSLPRFRIPPSLAKSGAFLMERTCSVLGIDPVFTQRNLEFFTRNRAYDIAKAKKLLHFRPQVAVSEGIEKTGDWYRERGFL